MPLFALNFSPLLLAKMDRMLLTNPLPVLFFRSKGNVCVFEKLLASDRLVLQTGAVCARGFIDAFVVINSSVGVVGEDSDRASGDGRLNIPPEKEADRQAEALREVPEVVGVATDKEGRTATNLLG